MLREAAWPNPNFSCKMRDEGLAPLAIWRGCSSVQKGLYHDARFTPSGPA